VQILGADLYNIILLADGIRKGGSPGDVTDQQVEWISETSRNALSSIRNYLDFSNQVGSSFKELVDNMEKYARSLLSPLGMELSFSREGDMNQQGLTGLKVFNFYLIFKESMMNIVKHSRAKNVALTVASQGNTLEMVVEDDGTGFTGDGVFAGQYGVSNIKARAEEIGARLQITSNPGSGTRVELSFPLRS
jgi:signal transduction histidine kinase